MQSENQLLSENPILPVSRMQLTEDRLLSENRLSVGNVVGDVYGVGELVGVVVEGIVVVIAFIVCCCNACIVSNEKDKESYYDLLVSKQMQRERK